MIHALPLRHLRALAPDPRPESRPTRLRRAGYADGERHPRHERHWANR